MTDYPSEYTPIFTPLAQEVGLVCAAVYGVVWRKCQLKDALCDASLATLGKEIGVDRATVMRNIKTLCDSGYLIDQTPGLRNVPHTYVLGKSVAECNSHKEAQADTKEDKSVVIRNSLPPETVAEDNKSVAHNNSSIKSVAQNNGSNQTVAESHLKKEESLNSESNNITGNNKIPPKGASAENISQQMFSALANLVKYDIDLLGEKQRGQLNQAEKKMRSKGYVPADLDAFGAWWYANDWRGRDGQAPSLNQIRETWRQFLDFRAQPSHSPLPPTPDLPPPEPLPDYALYWQRAGGLLAGGIVTRAMYDQILSRCEARPSSNGTFILAAPGDLCQQITRLEKPILQALNQFTKADHLEVITL